MATRSDWTWGVAASADAMQVVDDDWAMAMSPAERLELVYELSSAFDWSDDDGDEASVRLLGADCGVRSPTG